MQFSTLHSAVTFTRLPPILCPLHFTSKETAESMLPRAFLCSSTPNHGEKLIAPLSLSAAMQHSSPAGNLTNELRSKLRGMPPLQHTSQSARARNQDRYDLHPTYH